MTKADLVNAIASKTNFQKADITEIVEAFNETVINSLEKGKNIYLRGFGTFEIKKRAEKKARNISKNTTVIVPAHNIPFFKPSNDFSQKVKEEQ